MELVKPGYKHLEFEKESLFLITGVAGFIGSNLLEAILNLGYNVRGMDNFSTFTSFSARKLAEKLVKVFRMF